MNFWDLFWRISVFFSLASFFYMSAKVLIYGVAELKYMFHTLYEDKKESEKGETGETGD